MKRNLFNVIAVLAFVAGLSANAFAQAAERVSLTKSSPALVWEKTVPAGGSKTYVVALRKGQQIKLSFIEDSKQGNVDFGKFSLEEGADFDYEVEVTKDYLITVSNSGRKETNFRIFLTLEGGEAAGGNTPAAPSKPETVTEELSFQNPGDATRTRVIQPGQTVNFVFPGETGITAIVNVTDPSVTMTVDFCERMIPLNMDETCKLTHAGDWTVMVRNDTKVARKVTVDVRLDVHPPQSDNGETDVKVVFPKGETETWIEGTIDGESQKMFLFQARKGQKLTFAVYDDTNKLKVDFNKTPRKLNSDVKFVLTSTDEWAIYVDNPTRKSVSYRFFISIL